MLEFSQPTLPGADPLAAPDGALPRIYWLGSDLDGSDGWGVQASVASFWDGDNWYVRAVAVDAQGRSQSARAAEPLTILQSDRPHVRLLRPSGWRMLRGVERVTALVASDNPFIEQMSLYLQDQNGQLVSPWGSFSRRHPLEPGLAHGCTPGWPLPTVARITDSAGRQSLIMSELLTLRNQQGFNRFRLPAEDATLSGDKHGGSGGRHRFSGHHRPARGLPRCRGRALARG
jgi:hypothetical protein